MVTAAKKAAPAKKNPAAKAPGTALVKWDEILAAKAKQAAKVVSSIGGGSKNVLSFKGGKLSYQGGNVPGNALNVVVLSAVNENNFFEGRYDPNNPSSPTCYAWGSPDGDDAHMKPHEKAPNPQSGECQNCPNNEWGSAETGRGKACKNVVSLAMVSEDALESVDKLMAAEVFYAKLPVTSGKSWKGFVNDCGDKHYIQFLTELSVTPSGETYTVDFAAVRELPRDEVLGALLDRSEKEDRKWGSEPYPVFEPVIDKKGGRPQRRTIPVKAVAKPAAKKPKYA
jgi:hypothetical protein